MAARPIGWLLVAVLFLGTGCATVTEPVQFTGGFAAPDTPYGRALARYTRKVELYDGFATVAKGWATWRSPAFREAMVAAVADAYGYDAATTARQLARERDAARRVREFHLALYTPQKDWNDLESPNTLWRAYVELPGGARLASLEITKVAKSERQPVAYPYVTPWTREYLLRFPLLAGEETAEHLALVLTGPLGRLRFEF